jgi:hypothetical protein
MGNNPISSSPTNRICFKMWQLARQKGITMAFQQVGLIPAQYINYSPVFVFPVQPFEQAPPQCPPCPVAQIDWGGLPMVVLQALAPVIIAHLATPERRRRQKRAY